MENTMRPQKLSVVLFSLLLCASAAFGQNQQKFFLEDGDQLMFWGNSITDYGIYPRLIENYMLAHHPDWKLEFVNLGWGGDRSSFVNRLRRDIKMSKPTKVTVMLGMNDGLYRPFDPEVLSTYLDSMKTEIEIMKDHSDPEIMLIAPTLYELRCRNTLTHGKVDDFSHMRSLLYPETLARLTHELGLMAGNMGLPFYDLNYSSNRISQVLAGYDGNKMYTAEGVHPTVDGELHMGLGILEAMGAEFLVAETVIDAAAGKIELQDECTVSQLSAGTTEVKFDRLAHHLPLPINPSSSATMRQAVDFYDHYSPDLLTVKNLADGWYVLTIDDVKIDIVSGAELAGGINLSRYENTPQMLQACKLFEQTEIRNNAFYTAWRKVLLKGVGSPRDYTPFKTGVNTDSLDAAEKAAYKAQHKLNKPAVHRYELKQVKHPGYFSPSIPLAKDFLDGMIKVSFAVDSKTLRSFESPLMVRGNFNYAPQYQWGVVEAKGYYANIPVQLYDDGTHGDKKAGDGVWSLDMYLRKGSGSLWFELWDGRYQNGHWNYLHSDWFRNDNCRQVTAAWAKLLQLEGKDGEIEWIPIESDVELNWSRESMAEAVQNGYLYSPEARKEEQ
jgi:lysophospholipase L1-like esterase